MFIVPGQPGTPSMLLPGMEEPSPSPRAPIIFTVPCCSAHHRLQCGTKCQQTLHGLKHWHLAGFSDMITFLSSGNNQAVITPVWMLIRTPKATEYCYIPPAPPLQVSKLRKSLAEEYLRYLTERDARKILIGDLNELRYQREDMSLAQSPGNPSQFSLLRC